MNITQRVLKDAVRNLDALKAQYKILLPDGTELGELKMVVHQRTVVRRKRASGIEFGGIKKHIMPFLENLAVGDVAVIPIEKPFRRKQLYDNATFYARQLWGHDSHHICINKRAVELLRVA